MNDKLNWFDPPGIGYFPVNDFPYDPNYFEKYVGYSGTEQGREITQARIDLVKRHYAGPVVDVGIGCGQFVDRHGDARGYDVNPVGVKWLRDRGLYSDFYSERVDVLTFWDSLEHIRSFYHAVCRARKFVFISIPIFMDKRHALASKHFKTDEHCWYFTRSGLIQQLDCLGFDMVECNIIEQKLGREDIENFAFRRRDA